jgi:UDP-glucose 4-epimerase
MAVLVTGGAGYIGSVVAEELRATGVEVVVLDDLSRGHRSAVAPEVAFYEGDIGDDDLIKRVCRENEITAAMHFSAFADVGESVRRPDIYYKNNVVQTLRLLDSLVKCDVKQFVFSSSCATFGEPQYVPMDEKHPQWPTNPYGWTKLMVERILSDYEKACGLRSISLRYFNACGATATRGELHDPETHLIPIVLQAAAGTRSHVTILGTDYPTPDGTCIRDYIHVADLSDAHIRALKLLEDGRESDSFNLGVGQGFSVLEVIEAARRVTNAPIETQIAPRRPGDPSQLIADASKARSELGWTPKFTDLDTIIESVWSFSQKGE